MKQQSVPVVVIGRAILVAKVPCHRLCRYAEGNDLAVRGRVPVRSAVRSDFGLNPVGTLAEEQEDTEPSMNRALLCGNDSRGRRTGGCG